MRSYLDRGEPARASELVRDLDPAGLDAGQRLAAARACLAAGSPAAALAFAGPAEDDDSAEPEALLLQARALLALDRRKEALAKYDAAVAENSALEDLELRSRLTANVRVFPGREDRPALTVVSNDDTDESEMNRLLVPETEPVTFADVGGLEEVKEQVRRRIILPFQKPSLFLRFKRRAGGGILLYGPPGCGKTLLARATAGECRAQFFNVAISDVLDMYIGESERKLHAILEKARSSPPSVVFFDEIEALGGKRQYTREATSSKLVSQFLSELDGFANDNAGVLVLGATNVPWAVDPAFRRPGRFDRMLFVPPPDKVARAAILDLLLRERPLAGRIDVAGLARDTSGFSGADLKNLVESAVDEAIQASIERGEEVPVADAHLRAALREVKPTTAEWLTTARNYARYANEGGQYDEVLRFLEQHGKR